MSFLGDADTERLISLVREGDGQALGQLLEHYRNYLTLLARSQLGRRLQGKVEPTDLVQETFLKAHREFDQFRGCTEEELGAWLRQTLAWTVANQVRHYLGTRRRNLRQERQLILELDHSSRILERGLAAPGGSPSQQAVRREQAIQLANALEQLPDNYRQVLVFRHLEEMSFPEVAQRMDRTVDSVKNLWVRALTRLRRSLGDSP